MVVRVWLIAAACLLAAMLPPAPARPAAGRPDAFDPAGLADGFFAAALKRFRVPGAVFVLVKDGELVLARGYGYADLERSRPMNPDRTRLRVASISKLFIVVAVMQLVEQGRLDLHADVNTYLRRLRVPETYPEPVTLAGLLTHTSGLDERLIGMAVRRPADPVPFGEYLAAHLPPRVRPPGELIRYSNDGMALAALVVEDVTGQPFSAYVRQKVFEPLGMSRTGFDPVPAADLAAGYEFQNGAFRRMPFDHFNIGPAAGLLTTGTDLARFMVAILEDGRYGGSRILAGESVREVRRRQFSHHPQLPGWALGFFEHFAAGRRALAHDGDWRGFASLVFLLPEERTGLFVTNNGRSHRLNWELVWQFTDRYYPSPPSTSPEPRAFADNPGRFAGKYRTVRYGRGTVEKLPTLFEQFRTDVSADGRLRLHGFGPEPVEFVRVDRLLFRRVDAEGYLAFREDGSGRVTHLFLGGDRLAPTPLALERVPWYEATEVQLALVAALGVIFGTAVVGRLLTWLVGHRKPAAFDRLAFLVGGLNLGVLGGLGYGLFVVDRYEFAYGIPAGLALILQLPVVSAVLTPLLAALAVRECVGRGVTTTGRVYRLAVVLAAAASTWFAATWNLLPLAPLG